MLAEHKLKNLLDLISSSTSEELIWMNGYLNAIVSRPSEKKEDVIKPAVNKITITYGTETGNSKKIATDFAAKAKKSGINVKLVSLDQYRLNDLTKEEYFFTVVSTHGDGEPPAATKKFYEHIHNNGFRFEKLKYSVLALGDTSYPLFCKTGEDIDEQLNKLGGIRVAPLKKCDVEFDDEAKQWLEKVFETLSTHTQVQVLPSAVPEVKKPPAKKTYTGKVLSNIILNDKGSEKETFHMELAVDGPEYEPGDSIGIVPENVNSAVENIISLTGIDRNKEIEYRNEWFTVADLLKKRVNIIQLAHSVVKKYSALVGAQIPERKTDLAALLKTYPPKDVAHSEEVLTLLNPIAPRLYTIASSPLAHTDEIHITVKKDEFDVNGQVRFGLCSEYLSEIKPEDEIPFFVQKNKRFRLPADDMDIIMIGPGTGIAAFRSFLAERDAKNATGKNWLFFGEQHFVTDFLYQTEIQNWFETGVLTKVNTAFSRDQPEKIYVQHRMMQHGAEFFEWLKAGSYVYVCGTKDPMILDVEKTMLQIIEKFGGMTSVQSQQYLTAMKEEGRYMKDVY
ncbi:MAG TPA: flavodoxin domain-containing protein [Chitinophagaceae bacterium]|nr:flavodoxin domain-containing protein [Chitinophagaceae bacterium]